MDLEKSSGWMGVAADGSGKKVGVGDLGDRILILGRGAGDLARLFALSSAEAGRGLTAIDVEGSLMLDARAGFRETEYWSLLHEGLHLDDEGETLGELVSSAYSGVLGLSPDESAILDSAIMKLAEQNDLATPAAIYDALGGVESFSGTPLSNLKGKVASLRALAGAPGEGFGSLVEGNAVVTFASAPYPLVKELAAGLFLAKLVFILSARTDRPGCIMVTGAHRVFREAGSRQRDGRLLCRLLESRAPVALASDLPVFLDRRLLESVPVRIYSSDAWNGMKERGQAAALMSSFVISDDRTGTQSSFFPRYFSSRHYVGRSRASQGAVTDPALTRAVLELVDNFEAATRQSIVTFLSPEFLARDVGGEVDRLHEGGRLALEPKKAGSGPAFLAYTVTRDGKRLLGELSE